MPGKKKILMLLGSTKATSVNKQILLHIIKHIDPNFEAEIYKGLDQLPYFNPDLENDSIPESVKQFRHAIENAEGVIICTPEYIFSIPGILKNAIEWLVSTVIFTGKPTALITASSSGEKAHESLTFIMKTVGAAIGENSCLLIKGIRSKINSGGEITDSETKEKIHTLINELTVKVNSKN